MDVEIGKRAGVGKDTVRRVEKILLSRDEGLIEKAWVGFHAAKRLENYSDMKLYASVIQRLEKELKIEVNDFPELGLCTCKVEEDPKEEEEEEEEDNYVEISFDSL